jgi:hypothetical protein
MKKRGTAAETATKNANTKKRIAFEARDSNPAKNANEAVKASS